MDEIATLEVLIGLIEERSMLACVYSSFITWRGMCLLGVSSRMTHNLELSVERSTVAIPNVSRSTRKTTKAKAESTNQDISKRSQD